MNDELGEDGPGFRGPRSIVVGSIVFVGGFLAFAGGIDLVASTFQLPVPSLFLAARPSPAARMSAPPVPLPAVPATPLPAIPAKPQPAGSVMPLVVAPRPQSSAVSPLPPARERRPPTPALVRPSLTIGPGALVPLRKAAIAAQPARTPQRAARPLPVRHAAVFVPVHAGLPASGTLDPRVGGAQSLLVGPRALATPPPAATLPRDP